MWQVSHCEEEQLDELLNLNDNTTVIRPCRPFLIAGVVINRVNTGNTLVFADGRKR
jgi:hypothetical protein